MLSTSEIFPGADAEIIEELGAKHHHEAMTYKYGMPRRWENPWHDTIVFKCRCGCVGNIPKISMRLGDLLGVKPTIQWDEEKP